MKHSIYLEDVGAGLPVLALPGLGGGAHFFGGFARRLHSEYRVVSLDLPGTGRSGGPSAFSMESWVADLGDLVAERFADPVVLLGHSMGTILALKAWEAWPARIRGLIFVGGVPQVIPAIRERLTERLQAISASQSHASAPGAADLAGWGARVSPGVFARATVRERPETVALFERAFEAQAVETYTRCCAILLDATADAVVPSVSVPALAITGSDDQYAPPEVVAAFVRRIPSPTHCHVLPECGHLPFLEQPEAFASAVKSFLRTC